MLVKYHAVLPALKSHNPRDFESFISKHKQQIEK